ncbi:NAD-dependent epimerase/dehydratase family protein [Gammaproteobacteria bacterium]|nr:NAD-dependent epimerase/dehydratase family protein [Gammaproteobacteria bacterium]
MKKVLVTGGAGFVGSHTVDLLLKKGLKVVVVDNLSTGKLSNLNLSSSNLKFIQGDILDDDLLFSEISDCDAVLHLAALPSVDLSIDDPINSLKINLEGFLHILQAIRAINKPIRLVYASSAAIYGGSDALPCSDTAPIENIPLSPYALEKLNNENYGQMFDDLFKIKSLGLRYFNIYGERQDPNSSYSGVISKFIDKFKNNEVVNLFGDGSQSRDFIHVSDVARANWLALSSNYSGVLNIGTGISETLLNLISYMEKANNQKIKINSMPNRKGDILKSYADVSKANSKLDFSYSVSLSDGIVDLLV